jgi:hypothetical protein
MKVVDDFLEALLSADCDYNLLHGLCNDDLTSYARKRQGTTRTEHNTNQGEDK